MISPKMVEWELQDFIPSFSQASNEWAKLSECAFEKLWNPIKNLEQPENDSAKTKQTNKIIVALW